MGHQNRQDMLKTTNKVAQNAGSSSNTPAPHPAPTPIPDIAPPTQNRESVENNTVTKKAVRRISVVNYTSPDTNTLLDTVIEKLLSGRNEWAEAAQLFNDRSREVHRPARDIDSVVNKFDRLAGMKKKTGDVMCITDVRCAKHIAREIGARSA